VRLFEQFDGQDCNRAFGVRRMTLDFGLATLDCHKGSGGGLTGGTATTETSTQSQTTADNGAATNLSGAKLGSNGTINVSTADPEIVDTAVNSAIGAVNNSLGTVNQAIAANNNIASIAITQGDITNEADVQEASNVNLAAIDTLNNIAGDYSQIVANAAPQTDAAESEILAGYTPISPETSLGTNQDSRLDKIVAYVTIAGGVVALYLFLKKEKVV
jgi:hypothetical protein